MSVNRFMKLRLDVKVLLWIFVVLAVVISAGHYFTSRLQQQAILERARHRAASVVQDVFDMRRWQAEEARKERQELSKLPQPIRVAREIGFLFARETPLSHPNEYSTHNTTAPRWYYWRTLTREQLAGRPDESGQPSSEELAYRGFEEEAFGKILDGRQLSHESTLGPTDRVYFRAEPLVVHGYCLNCHAHRDWRDRLGKPIGIISVQLGLAAEQADVVRYRSLYLATATLTVLATLVILYLLIRVLILKPLHHLKDVSDRASSGDLSVRAHVHTGDELQSFAEVFNRMLQSVEDSQTHLRLLNRSLDEKISQLGLANLQLLEMNKLKSEFLANVSHELRTPLNSIIGFSELLADRREDVLADRQLHYVNNILVSGKRLLGLINELLDLARIESGKMEVRLSDVSLPDLVATLRAQRQDSLKPGQALVFDLEPDLPTLLTDEGKLTQILDNLLSNAVKFTSASGLITVRARTESDRKHVLISVSDTGVGIAPEHQTLVFDKFRQVDGSSTRRHAGAGLGLSIVKELSTLLGGSVTLESEPGQGSTFTVRLPVTITQEEIDRLRPQNAWGA